MILFVGRSTTHDETTEAAMVDGATYWQRVRMYAAAPIRRSARAALSVIGLCARFDQFFLMTAGQRSIARVFRVWITSLVSI